MRPIVLYLQKKNIVLGILLAAIIIIILKNHKLFTSLTLNGISKSKFINNPIKEAYVTLDVNTLCNKKYEKPVTTKPEIKKPEPTKAPTCKFGIDINPPTPETKAAISVLTSVPDEDIKKAEELITPIPEFSYILTLPNKTDIIKELIILNKLVTEPPVEIPETQIKHIATTILSDMNTVDPQLTSYASAFYSDPERTTTKPVEQQPNPFYVLKLPAPEIKLNNEAVNTIVKEQLKPLSSNAVQQLAGTLNAIHVTIPYEECVNILTRYVTQQQ